MHESCSIAASFLLSSFHCLKAYLVSILTLISSIISFLSSTIQLFSLILSNPFSYSLCIDLLIKLLNFDLRTQFLINYMNPFFKRIPSRMFTSYSFLLTNRFNLLCLYTFLCILSRPSLSYCFSYIFTMLIKHPLMF